MNAVSPTFDLAAVKDANPIAEVIGRSVALTKQGQEFIALCPFHAENTPSFSVVPAKGMFHCFGCGAQGDVIDFVRKMHNVSLPLACEMLGATPQSCQDRPAPSSVPAKPKVAPEWVPILPVPMDAPQPPRQHPIHGTPTHVAAYRNREGRLLGLIHRYEPPKGRKQVPSLTFCEHVDGRREWQWKSLPKPRPIYGAELLDAAPDVHVLVVEGEPKCDAARRLLGSRMIVVAWPGGASADAHVDWGILSGRVVVVWPDADKPGLEVADRIVAALRKIGADARTIEPPDGVAAGWDLADAEREGWTAEQVMERCELLQSADAPARRSANLPPIQITAGAIDLIATQGEDALIASKLPVFRRDKGLVRPVSQKVPASGGRMTVAAGLDSITPYALVDLLNQAVEWQKWNEKEKDWVPTNPPGPVAGVILSRAALSRLPSIAGVITTPTLRPDGSVLLAPGYDAATRLYHVRDPALRLPVMPDKPSRRDAEAALDLLSGLLREFPFVDEVSKAVALSAIITAVVRGAISAAPMHAFRASTAGSGKSYLADIVSMIATGRPCPVMAVADKDDETEKRLVGLLLAGFPIISLDNVNGELGGDLLCQAIERPLVRARPLGASEIIEIESRATLLATGNSLRVRGDMTRRTLLATLDAKMERPETREFQGNPAAEIAGDRGRYVAAALTLVRAYLQAGKPNSPSAVASFEEWNAWIRGSLVWLGCGDPAVSMEEAREDDPDLSELREVLAVWKEAIGVNDARTVREIDEASAGCLIDQDNGHPTSELRFPDFRAALLKIAGERGAINTKRLAKWFLDKSGRFTEGLRIQKGKNRQGGIATWMVSDE